jgi:hypothetical protein
MPEGRIQLAVRQVASEREVTEAHRDDLPVPLNGECACAQVRLLPQSEVGYDSAAASEAPVTIAAARIAGELESAYAAAGGHDSSVRLDRNGVREGRVLKGRQHLAAASEVRVEAAFRRVAHECEPIAVERRVAATAEPRGDDLAVLLDRERVRPVRARRSELRALGRCRDDDRCRDRGPADESHPSHIASVRRGPGAVNGGTIPLRLNRASASRRMRRAAPTAARAPGACVFHANV